MSFQDQVDTAVQKVTDDLHRQMMAIKPVFTDKKNLRGIREDAATKYALLANLYDELLAQPSSDLVPTQSDIVRVLNGER